MLECTFIPTEKCAEELSCVKNEMLKVVLKVLSEDAYNWECEDDPHPWRVKPSLIAAGLKEYRYGFLCLTLIK